MNKERRKAIQDLRDRLAEIKAGIEELQQQEQDYADKMPENMQGSERHAKAEEAAGELQNALDECDTVDGHLETAAQ